MQSISGHCRKHDNLILWLLAISYHMTASFPTPSELRRLRKGCDADGEKGWKCDAQISKVNVLDLNKHGIPSIPIPSGRINSESSRSHHHASNQHQAWGCGLEGEKKNHQMQLSSTVPTRQDRLRWNQFNHRHQHRREKKQHGSGHSTKPKSLAFSEQPPRITSNVNTVAIVSLRRRPCSTTFLNSSSRFIVDDYLNRKTL